MVRKSTCTPLQFQSVPCVWLGYHFTSYLHRQLQLQSVLAWSLHHIYTRDPGINLFLLEYIFSLLSPASYSRSQFQSVHAPWCSVIWVISVDLLSTLCNACFHPWRSALPYHHQQLAQTKPACHLIPSFRPWESSPSPSIVSHLIPIDLPIFDTLVDDLLSLAATALWPCNASASTLFGSRLNLALILALFCHQISARSESDVYTWRISIFDCLSFLFTLRSITHVASKSMDSTYSLRPISRKPF